MALPAAEATQRAAIERINAATVERDDAVDSVMVEDAAADGVEYTAAINAALRMKVRMISRAKALRSQRDRSLGAANQINAEIKVAEAAAGVPWDDDFGRQLLAELMTDPAAGLRDRP
jgi:hypothetical protein